MSASDSRSLLRPLAMVLPFALWGTAMAAMRPLLDGGTPLQVATLRLLPAGAVVLAAAWLLRRPLAVHRADWPWLLAFALVDGSLFQGLLAHGLGQTGAGLGSVLIDSQPLLVALLARSLFGEAINPVGWLGLLIGLLGIACLGLPGPLLQHWWLEGPTAIGLRAWSNGELWMLAAAAAMAVGTVLSRYASRHSDPVAVTGWHMLLGGLPLLLASVLPTWLASVLPEGGPAAMGLTGGLGGELAAAAPGGGAALWPQWSLWEWGLMAYATLLGSALAYGLFFWFASSGDLTGFTALTFLTPVFALLCGVLWLGEQLRPLQWLGALLALGSVLLINRRQQLWEPPPPDGRP